MSNISRKKIESKLKKLYPNAKEIEYFSKKRRRYSLFKSDEAIHIISHLDNGLLEGDYVSIKREIMPADLLKSLEEFEGYHVVSVMKNLARDTYMLLISSNSKFLEFEIKPNGEILDFNKLDTVG